MSTFTPIPPPTVATQVAVHTSPTLVATVVGQGTMFNSGQEILYVGGSGVTPSSFTVSLMPGQMYPFPSSGSYYACTAAGPGNAVVATWPGFAGGSGGNMIDLVAEFGIDNTGTVADNNSTGQITTALATLAAEGLFGFIAPQSNGSPAVVNIATTITLGNGNQTNGKSSIQGGGLIGGGFPSAQFIQPNSAFANGLATLNWTGGVGGPMISILGPLWGWRIENIFFTATTNGNALNPFWNHGGCGGYMSNCTFNNWSGTAIIEDISVSSLALDTLMNEYDHIFISTIPSSGVGLQIGPNSISTANCCFSWFHDMWIPMPASNPAALTYCIYDNGSDTLRFDRIYTGPNGANATGYHAHVGGGGSYIPGGHVFSDCDFQAKNGASSVSVAGGNLGFNGPITFRNLALANGPSINPQLPGIVWQCPESPLGKVTAPGFPATNTTVTNNFGVPCSVFITAGTSAITAVTIGGNATTSTIAASTVGGPYRVGIGQTIACTYAGGSPSWVWFGD